MGVETFMMDSKNSPTVFAPGKTATTGCQRETECSALLATREETIYRSLKPPLTRQKEHIGKDWSVNFMGESRGMLESTVPKI
jgi:hypothetical protein